MAQKIYAWLDNGLPRLRIVDSETGRVNVSWDFQEQHSASAGQRNEIQRLFSQLLLLTCKQELGNVRCYRLQSQGVPETEAEPKWPFGQA